MSQALTISQSPHAKRSITTPRLMGTVIVALVPALLIQTWFYGWNFLFVLIVSTLCCVGIEAIIQQFLMRQRTTVSDLSAVLTGILLALNVPASLGFFPILVGSVLAIGFGKMAFGGIGRNPFNPALIGRAFLLASFPASMTAWPQPFVHSWFGVDTTTAATPLTLLKETQSSGFLDWGLKTAQGLSAEAWSFEIYAVALLAGGLILVARKIITWRIPITYIAGLFSVVTPAWLASPSTQADPLVHLLMGGVMLGAFFMATDYSTSPMTAKAQLIYGFSAGLLCGVIRLWGSFPDGVAYSILIMNAVVPLLNKYLQPKRFGRPHG